MAKASELARVAPLYLGTPYKELDCQAFVERCLSDIGISKNLPGSNAWFREMTWTGTPEECVRSFGKIPKGAFLFILKQDGKEPVKYQLDGIGNASHIGIYTGMLGGEMVNIAESAGSEYNTRECNFGSGAIHSSQSRGKVCTSDFKGKSIHGGWNRVGIWDRLEYDIDVYEDKKEEVTDTVTVTVVASTGSTVNIRKSPSTSGALVDRVPVGTKLEGTDTGTGWYKVTYNGKTGYIMSGFVVDGDRSAPNPGMISVSRKELESIYNAIGSLLGTVG